jgi:hypothetical protein
MTTNDEQCISTPGQSRVKSSSISKTVLQICDQDIQDIKWKSDEILDFFYPVFPHVVCSTEHHLNQYKIVQFHIDNYTLGANYCRHSLKKGGACIFVRISISFVGNDGKNFLMIRTEAYAIRLLYNSYNICILTIYRAPIGNFACFIKKLVAILCSLFTLNRQLIICGDTNVNYLVHNSRRKMLDA